MRCALGKDGHRLISGHCAAQIVHLVADAELILARYEDRVVDSAHPANEWPALDTVIGNKSASRYARHNWYINPAMMVCSIKHIAANSGAGGRGCNAERPADAQQEQSRPRRTLSEQTPEIMQDDTKTQDREEQQHTGDEHDLPEYQPQEVAFVLNPCGRWQRRKAPYGDQRGDSPIFER